MVDYHWIFITIPLVRPRHLVWSYFGAVKINATETYPSQQKTGGGGTVITKSWKNKKGQKGKEWGAEFENVTNTREFCDIMGAGGYCRRA